MNQKQVKEELKRRCKKFLHEQYFAQDVFTLILRTTAAGTYGNYAKVVSEAMQEELDAFKEAFGPKDHTDQIDGPTPDTGGASEPNDTAVEVSVDVSEIKDKKGIAE